MRALLIVLFLASSVLAQAPKTPDSLVFVNGEQLTGTLERADNKGITFKSLMAGEINVPWANIKELRSDKDFAVLTTNEKLTRRNAAAIVPSGRVSVADKELVVATKDGPKVVPLDRADRLVDAAAFEKAVSHPPTFLHGWGGTAVGGVSLVRATQNSTTFTGAINLARSSPEVDWLPARNKYIVGYDQAYGTTSQAGTSTIKSNIYHANAERDDYFSPRVFVFEAATFDHNYSQLLDLQQAYGAGIGITLIKNSRQDLEFKGDIHYEREAFFALSNANPSPTLSLAGSTFSETYLRHLIRAIIFNESASISPSWNNTNAYSAHVNAGFVFPIIKGFGLNLNAIDDYLNNAPLGSKKNSVQYTTGLTYTIKPR